MSSYFHSASQSCPILPANCGYNLRLFRLFRGDSSGMDKSSSAKYLLYSDVVKGEPQEEDEEAETKKAIKELEIFVSQIFYNFFLFVSFFFSITLSLFFYTFFTHDIYPHPHPRPTTFSYTHPSLYRRHTCEVDPSGSWVVGRGRGSWVVGVGKFRE